MTMMGVLGTLRWVLLGRIGAVWSLPPHSFTPLIPQHYFYTIKRLYDECARPDAIFRWCLMHNSRSFLLRSCITNVILFPPHSPSCYISNWFYIRNVLPIVSLPFLGESWDTPTSSIIVLSLPLSLYWKAMSFSLAPYFPRFSLAFLTLLIY